MTPTSDLHIEHAPWNTLRPHPRNPRNGDTDAIAASLEANGQFRPIVVARDGTVLAGNHTYAAAGSLGWDTIAVVRLDLDPESPEAERIMLADNRTSDLGRYDDQALLGLLRDVGDLTGTGYTEDDLADLAAILDFHSHNVPGAADASYSGSGLRSEGVIPDKGFKGQMASYLEKATRHLLLEFTLDEYQEVTGLLERVRAATGVDNNSLAVLTLLREATP